MGGDLERWLAWQATLNPREVDLGLERPAAVASRMGLTLGCPLVIVGGTNGKGSCAVMVEAMLRAAGLRVGTYLSPHLHRYNERVRINGQEVADAALVSAFEAVERARGDTALTFFEYGTLAAARLIADARPDAAVMEVGLGGRLDAVNLFDADVAVLTGVALDHTDWLGADRESVGREKAGIFRPDRPAVCADPDPPASVLAIAAARRACLHRAGVDYRHDTRPGGGWDWRMGERWLEGLADIALGPGEHQRRNAAAALAAVVLLGEVRAEVVVGESAMRQGLAWARLPGRMQRLPGEVERVIDVAHNPDAAAALAEALRAWPARRTRAVLGMLAGKDAEGVVGALDRDVAGWHVAGLDDARGLDPGVLGRRVRAVSRAPVSVHADVRAAREAALEASGSGDRVLAVGSFRTAAAFLALETAAR